MHARSFRLVLATVAVAALACGNATDPEQQETAASGAELVDAAESALAVTDCAALQPGVVTTISAAARIQSCFAIAVPANQASLRVALSGGTGNPELYVRFGAVPTTRISDCKSTGKGTNESCTLATPAAGAWYVMVYAAKAYSGVSLTATLVALPPPPPPPPPSGAASLALVSGGNQVGAVNTMLPQPVVVKLVDANGAAIVGRNVAFQVTAGGGALSAAAVTTASDGTASVRWTLGLTRTAQQLTVSATDPASGNAVAPLAVSAQATGPLVVNSLEDPATPPVGKTTLRFALDVASPGERISFDAALDGQTILLTTVGADHTVLKAEAYSGMTYLGYQDRDYGKSALYARKNVYLDASALPHGVTLRWNGGDTSHARVLAVYGNLTMNNVTVAGGYSAAEPLEGNTAQPYTLARGGGLAVWGTARLSRCTIAGNTIVGDNTASRDRGAYGGGIYANGLDLDDVVVGGNTATGYGAAGGGIYSVGGADNTTGIGNDATLDRCVVSGNRVRAKHAYGGGVFTLAGGPTNLAWMWVTSSTIARNAVEEYVELGAQPQYYFRGGGIYMGGGSLFVKGSTIAENSVTGTPAVFSGKPNVGGGGVAATIGNAHTVEYAWLMNSAVVGNTLNGAPEDWFAGSLIQWRSGGYNLVGRLDFSQILVPIPPWMDLNRKKWPKVADSEGVVLAEALDVANARRHASVVSAGTDAGSPIVLWYPPAGRALDRIPDVEYAITFIDAEYAPYGVPTDDFLNRFLEHLRSVYGSVLGADFGSDFGDLTGVTFYGPGVTWPSNTQNAAWINFWRTLDVKIGDRLGMVGLGDDFWGTFTTGPIGNEYLTVDRPVVTFFREESDQNAKPRPSGTMGDIGAIEK